MTLADDDAGVASCRRHGDLEQAAIDALAREHHVLPNDVVGISRGVREGLMPPHGLRVSPVGRTSGWYIWTGGEMSEDPDFFVPPHAHLSACRPEVLQYLELPPGWRFLPAPGHEDVWFDAALEL